MGEFLLDFKATGTEEFAKAAKDTTTALDRQEANARKMSKWRNELAQLARSERTEAEKKLPLEKQMENLLARRAQLEERIARAGSNQLRLTALRLAQQRNEARIRGVSGGMGQPQGGGFGDVLNALPGGSMLVNAFQKLSGLMGGKFLPTALITAATVGLIKMAKGAAEGAAAMVELAERARTTLSVIRSLSRASSATGVDFSNVTLPAFRELSRIQGELQAGLGRTTDRIKAFGEFGITMDDIRKKQPEQLFIQIMRSVEKGAVTNQQYAAGIRLMGENFEQLISASKKGFAQTADAAANGMSPFLEGTQRVLGKASVEWDKFIDGLKHKWATLKLGLVGGAIVATDILGAALYGPLTHAPGALGKWAKKRQEQLLDQEAGMQTGGSGAEGVEAMEKKLKDAEANRKTRDEIADSEKQLKEILGDDAEDVIEGLRDRNAKPEEYKREISRAKRQKNRQGIDGESARPTPASDALQRIGLFVGDPTGVKREIQTQTRMLADVKRELEKVNNNLTKEP
jgi:hypothetical protein